MTKEERDRLCEIIFYRYFANVPEEQLQDANFWKCINAICQTHGVDSLLVSKAVRILMSDENIPEDFEVWYLCSRIEMTVRPMRKFTGIYWQKAKGFEEEFNAGKKPYVRRRITDPAMKLCLKNFIMAIYNVFGSMKYLNTDTLSELFS